MTGGANDDEEWSLQLPDFDDDLSETKGWYFGAKLVHMGHIYTLTFYDPVRLGQEIEDDLVRDGFFLEQNLIVIRAVNRPSIEEAVAVLISTGRIHQLLESQE